MNFFLQLNLIAHVVFGVAAIICFYGFLMAVLRKEPNLKSLKSWSLLGTVLIFASWLSGAYYYITYYGAAVKPVIKAGAYPWAHNVLMETKEHIFLFLPFLAVSLLVAVWLLGGKISADEKLKGALAILSLTTVVIGTAVTVMGFAVSAAAR